MAEPYYITTAISYPNGRPHIGHAYEAIAADAIARYHRQAGRDVRFQTGTDEHGLKMVQTARERGVETRALADEMSGYFKAMDDRLNISYDRFIRTVEDDHHAASRAIYEALGPARSPLAFNDGGKDKTHNDNYGAWLLANAVAEQLAKVEPSLAAHIAPGAAHFDPAKPPLPRLPTCDPAAPRAGLPTFSA